MVVFNANNPLFNNRGGIFLVSTVSDKDAVDNAINHQDLRELDNKSKEEQARILINQTTKADQLTCYALNTDFSFNLTHFINELEKIAYKLNQNQSTTVDGYNPIFIIALNPQDMDQYGSAIKDALNARHYIAYMASITSGYNTVADARAKLKDNFFQVLESVYRNPNNKFQKFLDSIQKFHNPLLSTGLPSVDKALGGGLDDQLYVIGAPSSIGKTTLVLQIADHIAAQQHYVIYFALEMSSNQLYAKTLNRLSYINSDYGTNYSKDLPIPDATTIMHGGLNKIWPQNSNTMLILLKALQQSGDLSKYKRIYDDYDFSRPTVSKMKEYITEFVLHNSVKPVVIIDYLQLIQSEPGNERETDKQRITNAIIQLKAISRDYHIPIIVISSFNRSSYNDLNADMTAFKESGDIDYSAEVLMTLSYDFTKTVINNTDGIDSFFQGQTVQEWLNNTHGDIREAFNIAKRQSVRYISLNILKNRFGKIPAPATLVTKPQYDIFCSINRSNKAEKIIENIQHETTIKNNRIEYFNNLGIKRKSKFLCKLHISLCALCFMSFTW